MQSLVTPEGSWVRDTVECGTTGVIGHQSLPGECNVRKMFPEDRQMRPENKQVTRQSTGPRARTRGAAALLCHKRSGFSPGLGAGKAEELDCTAPCRVLSEGQKGRSLCAFKRLPLRRRADRNRTG